VTFFKLLHCFSPIVQLSCIHSTYVHQKLTGRADRKISASIYRQNAFVFIFNYLPDCWPDDNYLWIDSGRCFFFFCIKGQYKTLLYSAGGRGALFSLTVRCRLAGSYSEHSDTSSDFVDHEASTWVISCCLKDRWSCHTNENEFLLSHYEQRLRNSVSDNW
jgi:hypothetical protein